MPLSLLDPANEIHAGAQARFDTEQIAWLGTVGRDGFPHAVPIWFLEHHDRIIVLSPPASAKVRNLRQNPRALLHLEGGPTGEYLTELQGTAVISDRPAAEWMPELGSAYEAKYRSGLAGIKLTMDKMAQQYSAVIEFTPVKLIAW